MPDERRRRSLEGRAEESEREGERGRDGGRGGGSLEKIPVTVCAGGRRLSRARNSFYGDKRRHGRRRGKGGRGEAALRALPSGWRGAHRGVDLGIRLRK